MRTRLVLTIAVSALVVTACGTEAGNPDGRILAYGYQPGMDMVYDMHQEMSMEMEASGAAAVMLGGGDMSMAMVFDQQVGYSFAEGPEPDSVAITMAYDLVDASGTVTAMGQTEFMTLDDLGAEAVMPPVEMVIDAQGNVIDLAVGGESLPTQYLDLLSGMGTPDLTQQPHIGPVFPDYPVGVGDAWTVDMSQEMWGMEIDQEARFRILSAELVGGIETLKVEGTIVTGAMDVNLAEMMAELANSGLGDQEFDMSAAMFESLGIEMRFSTERSEMEITSWFDPLGGIVVKAETAGPMEISIEMSGIPDAPGDIEMRMFMDLIQRIELAS